MPAARYSDEFKTQVVREVIEKDRTIASVAASYDLVAQTVGNWVARYRKERATDQEGYSGEGVGVWVGVLRRGDGSFLWANSFRQTKAL